MDIGSFCHSKQVKSEKSCKLHQLVLRKLPQGEDINIRLTEQVLSLYHFLVKSYDITKLSNREQKFKLNPNKKWRSTKTSGTTRKNSQGVEQNFVWHFSRSR